MSTTAPMSGKRVVPLRWFVLGTSALAVVAIGMAIALPIVRQHSAIRRIEALGGEVEQMPVGPEWLRDWVGEDWIGEEDMRWIGEVVSISVQPDEQTYESRDPESPDLIINNSVPWTTGPTIDDASFGVVAEFRQLRSLCAAYTKLSDKGLQHISGLSELEELNIDGTDVSDASFPVLINLKQLKELGLCHTKFSEAMVEELRKALPGCRVVTDPQTYENDLLKFMESLERSTSGAGGGMGGKKF